jgi:methionyl-tRNA formyltransferase
MLKIGYFADGPWAHEAFKLLLGDNDIDIKFICVRFETKDETLKRFADKFNIPYLKFRNINSTEALVTVEQCGCDLFVSMSFDQLFKQELINLPRLKTINCHAGKLPYYRGRNVLNWVLINDEHEFGITVHYIDPGIDTGDIILQKIFPITDADDYNSLLMKAYTECASILHEAIRLFIRGEIKPLKQADIHPVGFYCSQRKDGDELIDWKQTSRKIFCFIRALSRPGPMARSSINGKEIKLNKARMIKDAPNYEDVIGAVVGITCEGLIIKTLDNTIEITEFEYDDKIRIGDRFK